MQREKSPEMMPIELKFKLDLLQIFTQGWLCLEKAFHVNWLLKGRLFVSRSELEPAIMP